MPLATLRPNDPNERPPIATGGAAQPHLDHCDIPIHSAGVRKLPQIERHDAPALATSGKGSHSHFEQAFQARPSGLRLELSSDPPALLV
jgi:hypothetical protein